MTGPQGAQHDTELDRGASTSDAPADVDRDLGEGVAADYQARLREFDNVDSTPVVSFPVESRELSESDLKL